MTRRPAAQGSDVVEPGNEGSVVLTCSVPKGWVERKARTPTSAEHPGTAVVWENEHWEVVAIEAAEEGRVRYTLAPWDEQHVIRVSTRYDEESERLLAAEYADRARRRGRFWLVYLLAPVTGLLPRPAQERLEAEYGIPAARLSAISAVVPFLFGIFCVVLTLAMLVGGMAGQSVAVPPLPVLLFGNYLAVESAFRLALSFGASQPIGSLLGTLPWIVWKALSPRPAAPPRSAEAPALPDLTPPPGELASDAFRMREPYLALLTPAEQALLAARFGFEPLRWGRISAWFLLVLAALTFLGALAALQGSEGSVMDLLLLLASGALLYEQAVRLRKLARKEAAGSALAPLVRAASRRLLEKS